MNFAVIDFIFSGLIVFFIIRCYIKGFISELLSMAAVLFGILAALFFFRNGAEILRTRFEFDTWLFPEIVSFLAIFLIVALVINLVKLLLKEIISRIKLGGADRFLGMVLGFAEGIAVVSLILFLFIIQPFFDAGGILADSFFARFLLPIITGEVRSLSGV